jgi:hypothetical protein
MRAHIVLAFQTLVDGRDFDTGEMLRASLLVKGEIMLHKILLPEFLYKFTGAKSGLQPSNIEGAGRTGGSDCNKGEKERGKGGSRAARDNLGL